jgi:hypothetical protein
MIWQKESDMPERRTGGCLCGAVRYAAEGAPVMVVACHCKNCQRQSGSALSTIAAYPRDAVSIEGELTAFHDTGESGGPVIRKFCGKCGSPIISDIPQPQLEGLLFVKTGTMDDTSGLAPATHLWTTSAQHWFVYSEGVAKVERQ